MSRAKRKDEKLDLIFHALSDYRRRQVLAKLSQGPRIIRELGADFEMSKHEITVGQFRVFVSASGYQTTAEKQGWAYVMKAQAG